MMTLDQVIYALNILRDNIGGTAPVTVLFDGVSTPINHVGTVTMENWLGERFSAVSLAKRDHASTPPSHYPEIDAREADDLRKLERSTAQFRASVVEWSTQRHKQKTSEESRRLVSQMVETARDMRQTMGHIYPDCDR